MLDFGPGSFFLTPSQLADSPSSRHGISAGTEKALRLYGCEIIQEAGILLRLPQAVPATAQVLFHRFFCKQSFRDFDVRCVASSCFWLSMKLEEQEGASNRGRKPSQLNDVVSMFEHIRARREGAQPLPPHAPAFKIRREELLKLEMRILVEFGFVCHVEHPHKLMLGYLNSLEASKGLIQESWNLVNDSLRTTLCVCYPSNVVACGIIYAAARRLSVPLPENPPWWVSFDVTIGQIYSVCDALADLYRQSKSQFIDVRTPASELIEVASSLPEDSSMASAMNAVESLFPPLDSASNCGRSADVNCNNSIPVESRSSASKVLSCVFLNASGCPPRDLLTDDFSSLQTRIGSSEQKKRPRESPGESDRKSTRSRSSYDIAHEWRRGYKHKESGYRDAYREPERKHRWRGDYSRCSRYHDGQSLSTRHSYGHVRG